MSPIENAAEAAKIIFKQIRPTLVRCPKNHKIINDTIEIIRGFVWNRDLVVAVSSGPINDFMHLIKATRISKDRIEFPRQLFRGAFFDGAPVIPQHWEIWRTLLSQFLLYEILPFEGWMRIISSLETRFAKSPLDLAILTFSEATVVDTSFEGGGNVVLLWQSSLCWRGTS